MTLKCCMITASSALALGAVATSSQASPLDGLRTDKEQIYKVEPVADRCWWRNGTRYCDRYHVHGYRGRYREYGFPENYRTGSNRWWREMDREDRGGRRR